MTNIISYSLFEPKQMHSHRFWDKCKSEINRYWYNIPAIILANKMLYPDFAIRIHISSNIQEHSLFSMLQEFEKCGLLEIAIMQQEYTNTEPTIWRYEPVFNKTANVVLCRDIDSLPTSDEYLATKYFLENENYLITTIRSHTNHRGSTEVMLGGLCGFRPKPFNMPSFNEVYATTKNSTWGIDQNILINLFASNKEITTTKFLDSRLSNKEHSVSLPVISCDSKTETFYRQFVESEIKVSKLLNILDEQTSWPGEPIDSRLALIDMLKLDNPIASSILVILNNNSNAKEFYSI